MKCIKCGAQLSEGMAFCPACGAAQNENPQSAVNNQQPEYGNGNTYQPQEQQQWQPQQPQGQQQWQPQPQQQSQPQQQQQWQPQQPYSQYQQQNNGFAQNNLQYGNDMTAKKSSKKPLIIALIAAIIIIIGLAVTCVVLIISKDSSSKNNIINSNSNNNSVSKTSTAEDTVEAFLKALVEGDYSKASEYVLSGVDYLDYGDVDLSKSGLKKNYQYLTGYEIIGTEGFSRKELQEINDDLDYSDEITDALIVGVNFSYNYDDDDAGVYVVKTSKGWYIIAIDN